MKAWQEDSMIKVFQYPLAVSGPATGPATAAPADRKPIPLHAARNEVASAQFVLRAEKDITDLKCQVGPLVGPGGARISSVCVRYVGYVPVKNNSDESAIRPAPADFPDPLFESAPAVKACSFQPIWVTINVPKDAAPGAYKGKLKITAGGHTVELPIDLTVHSATLSDKRTLMVANALLHQEAAETKLYGFPCNVEEDRYWGLIAAFAKNMAEHRQNTTLMFMNEVAKGIVDSKGKLTFDFSRLDRWIKTFVDAGVLNPPKEGVIEGSGPAYGKYNTTDHKSVIWTVKDGKAVEETIPSFTEQHYEYLRIYMPALQSHLEKKGWLGLYRQHIMDEPTDANRKQYMELAAVVRQAAPKLKFMEPTHCADLVGAVDLWIPETDYLAKNFDFYKGRQKAGEELWFYICLNPHTPHLNRFIDYPLLKARMVHWANFKYEVPGYLHWGWNCWPEDPFHDVELGSLPPGDCLLTYPKPGGVLDSIRGEAMLEGVQDYELLKVLAAKDPEKAKAICDQVLQDWTHYTLDTEVFRDARKQLLEALSEK